MYCLAANCGKSELSWDTGHPKTVRLPGGHLLHGPGSLVTQSFVGGEYLERRADVQAGWNGKLHCELTAHLAQRRGLERVEPEHNCVAGGRRAFQLNPEQ